MCLYPRELPNPKYKETKKNKGIIPKCKDERLKTITVNCGNCQPCRKSLSGKWNIRLQEQIREGIWGEFVTLTFSEKSLVKLGREIPKHIKGYERENTITKIAIRRFADRMRKSNNNKMVKRWFVTELGHNGTERVHMHGIIWNEKYRNNKPGKRNLQEKELVRLEIEKIWKYGWVGIGDYVNGTTIGYIVKYITKIDRDHPNYKSRVWASNGMGANYLKRTDAQNNRYQPNGKTNEYYKDRTGIKRGMPQYLKNKLYTEEERELLRLEKLDEQENTRWIGGIQVDVSTEKGRAGFRNLRKEERQKNRRLGFGDKKKNWDAIKEEEAKREALRIKREQKQWSIETRIKKSGKK